MFVGTALLGDRVSFVVAFFAYVLAQVLVVDLVAVFALDHTEFACEFLLCDTLLLDGVVGCFEGFEEHLFAHFLHFAFNHHDVVVGGAYHEFEIGFFELVHGGVDDELAVDAGNAYFRDGSLEGNVADGERC